MNRRVFLLLALCLGLLSACSSSSTSADSQAVPTVQQSQPGSDLPSPTTETLANLLQTEQTLLATPPQSSNLYALIQELKTHTVAAPARIGVPPTEHVGQEDTFWMENQDTDVYAQIHARLVVQTAHASIYVEDGQPFNLAALQSSAATFEQQVYAPALTLAGSNWPLGNTPVTIVNVTNLGSNNSGLFAPQNEYPTSINPYSNQREMFYIDLDGVTPGTADYASALANEFQQLLDWHTHPLSQDWLNQGLALLTQHMDNYSVDGADEAFLKAPDTQLTAWSNDPTKVARQAGASYLFLDYFVEHYGGYTTLKDLLQDPAPPPTDFDDVLAKQKYTDRFTDVLNKWLVANLIADPSIDNGEYGYPTIHIPAATPQHVVTSYPLSEGDTVSQYGAEYYDLHPTNSKGTTLSINLTGASTVRLIGNDPLDSAAEWWGNQGDNMDSTLTRSFDLSSLKGQHATLQFATWFDLQEDHDYGYVEVSTDNGSNWTTLQGNFTTTSNPAGLNLGNGYTGISGGGPDPAWVQESVDLTPYAGKKILLRFEEVTANSSNLQGFAIDQVRIPELHFQDTMSSTNGWVSKGFVYTNNILPEHFLVQAIVYTSQTDFTVQPMNVDLSTAQGTLKIPNFGSQVTRVVLVVSAYALDTMLQAHYQLQIRA